MREKFSSCEDQMNRPPHRVNERQRFVPIEEVPGDELDPSQALMAKEEAMQAASEDGDERNARDVEDVNDLSRPPSYLRKKFVDPDEDGGILTNPGEGPDEKGDGGILTNSGEGPDEAGGIIERGERGVSGKREPDNKALRWEESHGKRGREPRRKNKRLNRPGE